MAGFWSNRPPGPVFKTMLSILGQILGNPLVLFSPCMLWIKPFELNVLVVQTRKPTKMYGAWEQCVVWYVHWQKSHFRCSYIRWQQQGKATRNPHKVSNPNSMHHPTYETEPWTQEKPGHTRIGLGFFAPMEQSILGHDWVRHSQLVRQLKHSARGKI